MAVLWTVEVDEQGDGAVAMVLVSEFPECRNLASGHFIRYPPPWVCLERFEASGAVWAADSTPVFERQRLVGHVVDIGWHPESCSS